MNQKLIELGERFSALKKQHEALKTQLDDVRIEWELVEEQLLAAMTEDCINSFDVENLGKFTVAKKNYLSVNAANKPSFYGYLQESGNGDLLKLDVNPRTLTSFLKGHLEEVTKKFMSDHNLDQVDAEEKALEYLKDKGASYFSEASIRFK